MKLFFWQLNAKEKFIRVLWTGALALILLYAICLYFYDDFVMKIALPAAFTIMYIVDLVFRYKKMKRMKLE